MPAVSGRTAVSGRYADATPRSVLVPWAWYRADVGVTGTSTVSQWNDLSGRGHHLTASGGSRPALATGTNGRPVIRFGGTHSMITLAAPLVQTQRIFALLDITTYGSGGVNDIVWDGLTAGRMVLGTVILNSTAISAGTSLSVATGIANNTFEYISCLYNGASSEIRSHGAVIISGDANTGSSGANGFTLGALAGGTRGIIGDFCEVIIYDAALSAGNITTVESYLAAGPVL